MMGKIEQLSFRRAPNSFLWKMFQALARSNQYVFVSVGPMIHIFTYQEEVIKDLRPMWLKISEALSGRSLFTT
jgi:hypothetical protein